MRHLGSIVLSMLLVPIVYVLTGIGLVDWSVAESGSSLNYGRLAVALMALLVAGLAYATLVLARLSPLGLILAGLALFGVSLWETFANDSFVHTMPRSILGVDQAGWAVAGPVGALLALPLVATVISPRRWRRWANPPAAVAPTPAYAPPPAGYPGLPPAAQPMAPSQPAPYAPQYAAPTSPAGSFGTPISPAAPAAPNPTVVDPTSVLPGSGPLAPSAPQYPPVWPAQEPFDPEATRKL
jgi:hypothetical protein